jgi:hypothetical protein
MGRVAMAQEEPGQALELFQRSGDVYAALGLSRDVTKVEEMIERAKAMLSSTDKDEGAAL